jgi:hypothetical protein
MNLDVFYHIFDYNPNINLKLVSNNINIIINNKLNLYYKNLNIYNKIYLLNYYFIDILDLEVNKITLLKNDYYTMTTYFNDFNNGKLIICGYETENYKQNIVYIDCNANISRTLYSSNYKEKIITLINKIINEFIKYDTDIIISKFDNQKFNYIAKLIIYNQLL